MRRVITFGTFDLLHVGHVRLLTRARALGDHLTVGVSTDDLNTRKKSVRPAYPQAQRLEIIRALRCVDEVFLEESLEAKRSYILTHDADVLVMGDDWQGTFDHLGDVCEVVYLPRTPGISTTHVKDVLGAGDPTIVVDVETQGVLP